MGGEKQVLEERGPSRICSPPPQPLAVLPTSLTPLSGLYVKPTQQRRTCQI